MRILAKLIVYALAVVACAYLLPGVSVSGPEAVIAVTIVLVLLNTFVKPILKILMLPITLITLGLFTLIINATIMAVADQIVEGLYIDNFLWAIVFGLVFSIIVSVMEKVDGK